MDNHRGYSGGCWEFRLWPFYTDAASLRPGPSIVVDGPVWFCPHAQDTSFLLCVGLVRSLTFCMRATKLSN